MAAFSRFSALLEIVPLGPAINYFWLAIWSTRILSLLIWTCTKLPQSSCFILQGISKDEDAVEDNEWPCMGLCFLTVKLLVAMCLPVTIMLQDWSLVEGTFDRWHWRNTLLDVACSYLQRKKCYHPCSNLGFNQHWLRDQNSKPYRIAMSSFRTTLKCDNCQWNIRICLNLWSRFSTDLNDFSTIIMSYLQTTNLYTERFGL
jgi:hypothetical protein